MADRQQLSQRKQEISGGFTPLLNQTWARQSQGDRARRGWQRQSLKPGCSLLLMPRTEAALAVIWSCNKRLSQQPYLLGSELSHWGMRGPEQSCGKCKP